MKDKFKGEGAIKHAISILNEKQHRKNLLITILIFLVSYSFLYGLWRIPVIDFGISRMSAVSIFDYVFIAAITIFASILIVLFIYEKKNITRSSSISSIGGFGGGLAGFFGAICPVCQGIVVVALGSTLLNIPTSFLTQYSSVFKISSIGLLGLALFLKAESIYTGHCEACNILNK
ncbi:hypothetical protein HYV49_02025 [Candidatus Pacearchaeota archaeon]|nr:hypothetical protein [Candidatus Pacearchaeota archaeon]